MKKNMMMINIINSFVQKIYEKLNEDSRLITIPVMKGALAVYDKAVIFVNLSKIEKINHNISAGKIKIYYEISLIYPKYQDEMLKTLGDIENATLSQDESAGDYQIIFHQLLQVEMTKGPKKMWQQANMQFSAILYSENT